MKMSKNKSLKKCTLSPQEKNVIKGGFSEVNGAVVVDVVF